MKSVFNLKLIWSYHSIIYIGIQIPREPDEEKRRRNSAADRVRKTKSSWTLTAPAGAWERRHEEQLRAPLGPHICCLLSSSLHPPHRLIPSPYSSPPAISPHLWLLYSPHYWQRIWLPSLLPVLFFPSRSPSFETLSSSVLFYQAFAKSTLSSNSHQCICNSLQSLTLLSFFFDLPPH